MILAMTLRLAGAEHDDLGAVLESARKRAGLSFKAVERLLIRRLGDVAPTAEAIRLWHRGFISPGRGDITIALALADLYSLSIDDLPPTLAGRIHTVADLLKQPYGCITAGDLAHLVAA